MIEKLDLDNGYATVDWLPTQHGKRCGAKEIQTTVNQLVDAVNEIMTWRFETDDEPAENGKSSKMEQDPYAEQRKWIGKLCWFWDEDRKDAFVDVLGYVYGNSKYPYVNVDCYNGYKHCEPVKPDSELIYHGE